MVSGYDTGVGRTLNRSREYDQIVKGNVKITKTGDDLYKIVFLKASEFTLYQVWQEGGDNGKRYIVNDNSKNWQELLIANQKLRGFAPTAIMAVGNCKWAFVITNAYFVKNRLVFDVSTNEIVNLSTTVKKGLKTGVFKNARFDIDNVVVFVDVSNGLPVDGEADTIQPQGNTNACVGNQNSPICTNLPNN